MPGILGLPGILSGHELVCHGPLPTTKKSGLHSKPPKISQNFPIPLTLCANHPALLFLKLAQKKRRFKTSSFFWIRQSRYFLAFSNFSTTSAEGAWVSSETITRQMTPAKNPGIIS